MAKHTYEVLDLKALRCFEATARNGSITRAAIELGLTDAAVSQRIKALEKRLGVKLYESRGGHVQLTQAGLRARQSATRLFDEIEEFERVVADEESTGDVTLGAEDPILRYLLPAIAEEFGRVLPNARMRLVSRRSRETVELVRRNEIDIGIVHQMPFPAELAFHPWRTYEAKVLMRRGHPLARRKVPTVDDLLHKEILERYPQVIAEADQREPPRVKVALERRGLPFNVGLEVGTVETIKHYIARNDGIAVVPGFCIDANDHSAFHVIDVPDEFEGDTVYGWIMRRDKHLTTPLRGLIELLRASAERASRGGQPDQRA